MVTPILPPPPDDASLWRYMNFTKFGAMLSTKSLYFTRGDAFPDKFEGAMGSVRLEEKYDDFYKEYLRKLYLRDSGSKSEEYLPERLELSVAKSLESLRKAGEWQRRTTFINCWYEADHESEAMWSLYAGWRRDEIDSPGSIVIVTTFGKLSRALSSIPSIYVGKVKYVDRTTTLSGLNEAFWYKSKSFEHEREVRAVLHRHGVEDSGVLIAVDLAGVIREIRLSPFCPVWFEELMKDVSEKYGYRFDIRRSSLEDTPFY
jgi:hypothetical protein